MNWIKCLAVLVVVFCAFSCLNKDDGPNLSPQEQLTADIDIIETYLSDNNIAAIKTPTGLHYMITTEGSGKQPNLNSTVEVKYKGYYTNGNVFDQTSGNKTINFPLRNLILAWQEGIPFMKTGGKATLFCPSSIAYGTRGAGSVPPNTVLLFDIDLIKVTP